jgi:hypothetical protein
MKESAVTTLLFCFRMPAKEVGDFPGGFFDLKFLISLAAHLVLSHFITGYPASFLFHILC